MATPDGRDNKAPPKIRAHAFTDSSVLSAATWNEGTEELTIVFRSGRSYVYQAVPENVWEGFTSASSAGQYFNQNIKDSYA